MLVIFQKFDKFQEISNRKGYLQGCQIFGTKGVHTPLVVLACSKRTKVLSEFFQPKQVNFNCVFFWRNSSLSFLEFLKSLLTSQFLMKQNVLRDFMGTLCSNEQPTLFINIIHKCIKHPRAFIDGHC